MVPGPVQYKRDYALWLLILLIIICWPAAIVYYFTRKKVPVQTFQTYSHPEPYSQPMAAQPAAGGKFCSACGTSNVAGSTFCSRCGKPLA